MAVTKVQGKYVFFEFSENNVDWLKTVCLTNQDWNLTKDNPVVRTQCGTFYGDGIPEETITVNGMANITPAAIVANKGEASVSKLYNWAQNGTLLYFRRAIFVDPTIAVPVLFERRTGRCVLSEYSEQLPIEDALPMTFATTVQVQGTTTVEVV
ncbi:MAG: hypothetical protein J0M30_14815 [Chitinophagales bacterium]|nr:hypothetical protein [Chitinophagales bacterium]